MSVSLFYFFDLPIIAKDFEGIFFDRDRRAGLDGDFGLFGLIIVFFAFTGDDEETENEET